MKPVLKGLDPFVVPDTKYLILGSFPSVKSLEYGFYYMHPENRFYQIIATIFQEKVPVTVAERKTFLIKHHISLFDMIKSCNRSGSLDSNIKDIIPNDLSLFFQSGTKIGCTGKTAYHLFVKLYPQEKAYYLSSPSPANRKYFSEDDYWIFFKNKKKI